VKDKIILLEVINEERKLNPAGPISVIVTTKVVRVSRPNSLKHFEKKNFSDIIDTTVTKLGTLIVQSE
jgi:hypothetical protein